MLRLTTKCSPLLNAHCVLICHALSGSFLCDFLCFCFFRAGIHFAFLDQHIDYTLGSELTINSRTVTACAFFAHANTIFLTKKHPVSIGVSITPVHSLTFVTIYGRQTVFLKRRSKFCASLNRLTRSMRGPGNLPHSRNTDHMIHSSGI